jgi:hypothetical protein
MKLSSSSQMAIQEIVRGLPEDSLSMAWRSQLNERLRAEAVVARPKRRFTWFALPAVGLSAAAAFAFIAVFHTPTQTEPSFVATHSGSAMAVGLFDTYRQESMTHEITGSGPDPSSDNARVSIVDAANSMTDQSEVDSDTL